MASRKGPDSAGAAGSRVRHGCALPQALQSLTGLLHHTAFQVLLSKDAELPLQRHVDTLELQPGDLRNEEFTPEQ